MDDNSDEGEEEGEDAFMTIGKHLRKESGWYRGLRALKKRQIEREKVGLCSFRLVFVAGRARKRLTVTSHERWQKWDQLALAQGCPNFLQI